MQSASNQQMVQMIADQRILFMITEVLEEHLEDWKKKWFTPKPKDWHEMSLPSKAVVGILSVSFTCFFIYFAFLSWVSDLVMSIFQGAIAEFVPSARGDIQCRQTDVSTATIADTCQPLNACAPASPPA